MITKKKLLKKISELEHKQELMERKMKFLLNKYDGEAVLSIDQDDVWWQNIVRVYYMLYGEVKCAEIRTHFENDAKIVREDTYSVAVCLTNSKGGKTYELIDKSTGIAITVSAGFGFEKEVEEEKAND